MTVANTGAQPTGPMTLEQGLAAFKAKMAENNAQAEDTAIPLEPEDGEEAVETADDTQQDENTEAVSADESESEAEEPDDRPVILPDGSQITVEEARKGYLRQADFTRKTQEVAKEREALAARESAAVQNLGALYQQLASLQETEPNWLQLAQDPNVDPKQLQMQQAYWQNKKAVLEQTRQIVAQTEANNRAVAQSKAREALLANDNTDSPWKGKTQSDLDAGLSNIGKYVSERFPNLPLELLAGLTNPEAFIMIEESRQFRELQKAKPKAQLAVKDKPKPFKPGAKSTVTPQAENLRLLHEAFLKNPSPENAFKYERAKSGR